MWGEEKNTGKTQRPKENPKRNEREREGERSGEKGERLGERNREMRRRKNDRAEYRDQERRGEKKVQRDRAATRQRDCRPSREASVAPGGLQLTTLGSHRPQPRVPEHRG